MFKLKRNLVAAAAILGVLMLSGGGMGLCADQSTMTIETAERKTPLRDTTWRLYREVSGLKVSYVDMPVFSADGKTLVVIDHAKHGIQVRDARTGKLRKTLAVDKMCYLGPGLALSADGSTVAILGATFHGYFAANAIKILDVVSGKTLLSFVNEPGCRKELESFYPMLLALSPDGRHLAWRSQGGMALFYLWDQDSNTIRQFPSPLDHGWAANLLFSLDGKTLACGVSGTWPGGESIKECFYETATGKEIGRASLAPLWSVQTAAYTPDGNTLAVAGEAGHPHNARQTQTIVHLLDTKTFRPIKSHIIRTNTIPPDKSVSDVTYISCSRDAIVWCLTDSTGVLVWDRLTDTKEVIVGKAAGCPAVISPHGRTLTVLHPQKNVLSLWRRSTTTDTLEK